MAKPAHPTDGTLQSPATATGISITTGLAIVLALSLLSVTHLLIHYQVHSVFSVHQAVLAVFLALNLLVNFWEIGLFWEGDSIRDEYLASKEAFKGRPMDYVMSVFHRPIPLRKLASFKQWRGIWSGYCHFDPGYSRRGSFGFNIDVGNGFSTFLPATLFALGMTFPLMPARALGIIGVMMFWQMFYGTVVYFFQFFYAGRHRGHSRKDLFIFVVNSNGLWFVFPLWGLLASIWMIYEDSYRLFTDPASTSLWSIF